jgi:hypothetical protein
VRRAARSGRAVLHAGTGCRIAALTFHQRSPYQ